MSIRVEDESNVDEYLTLLKELANKELQIGVFGEDDSELLMIARVNEFGCRIEVTEKMRNYLHAKGLHLNSDTKEINIPERSFMRDSFDKRHEEMAQEAENLLERVLELEIDVDTFYKTLGEIVVGKVQKFLTELDKPKNHSFTVKQKESSNPLIDEGRLRQAINYKVK
jgi:hypothetical protein